MTDLQLAECSPWKLRGETILPHTNDTDIGDFRVTEQDAFELCRGDLELKVRVS